MFHVSFKFVWAPPLNFLFTKQRCHVTMEAHGERLRIFEKSPILNINISLIAWATDGDFLWEVYGAYYFRLV